MAAILIKNGLIYDGSGNEPVKEDVLIRGEKILKRGNFPKNRAEKTIDAMGAIVTPGFIDVNSPADHYLEIFRDDFGRRYLQDGVTAAIGGNCGASLAPVTNHSLLSLRKWSDISGTNINWHGFKEFFRQLERRRLGINFGTLVGHGTVRRAILRNEMRDLTENEMQTAKKTVSDAFREGVLGISFGLEFIHSKFAPFREIEGLADIASKYGRVCAVHLRNYGSRVSKSLDEAILLAKKTGVNLEVSHFEPSVLRAGEYLKLKEKIEEESAKIRINFDCNPSPYTAIPVYQLLPERLKKENLETMFGFFEDGDLTKEILSHLRGFDGENIRIGEMPAHLGFLYGKSLRDYAVSNKISQAESLLKIMKSSRLRGVILRESTDKNLIDDFVFSPSSLIASGETGSRGIFLEFLKLAEDFGFSTEKAVAKITALPAEKYNLKLRGRIKENYYADVLVIKDGVVKDAVVNGEIAVFEGDFKDSFPGKVLKYVR